MAEAALGEDALRLLQSVKRLGPHQVEYDGNLVMGNVTGSIGNGGNARCITSSRSSGKGTGKSSRSSNGASRP